MRVNARFDELTQQQLEYLTQVTGQSVSHVVRESVAAYYAQLRRQRAPSSLLALAGRGDSGRTDIASNYKAHIADIIQRKHGLEPLQPLPEARTAAPRGRRRTSGK
jgi:hypothetical protein